VTCEVFRAAPGARARQGRASGSTWVAGDFGQRRPRTGRLWLAGVKAGSRWPQVGRPQRGSGRRPLGRPLCVAMGGSLARAVPLPLVEADDSAAQHHRARDHVSERSVAGTFGNGLLAARGKGDRGLDWMLRGQHARRRRAAGCRPDRPDRPERLARASNQLANLPSLTTRPSPVPRPRAGAGSPVRNARSSEGLTSSVRWASVSLTSRRS
jgi:hypothetical protein